jgi:hypothetical protein
MDIDRTDLGRDGGSSSTRSLVSTVEPFDMILEDLDDAITSLMRLTKPLNDYYLQSEMASTNQRSSVHPEILRKLGEQFPQCSRSVLYRLARTISDRRGELITMLNGGRYMDTDEIVGAQLHSLYESLTPMFFEGFRRPLELNDSERADESSVSSLASGNLS